MFWLIWQMGLFLLIAFGGGLLTGWLVWSAQARGNEADEALNEAARLRQENEALARRLGDAEARLSVSAEETVKTGAVVMPDLETTADEVGAEGDDDLTAIKGLGPRAAEALREGGVTRYAQIAEWSESDRGRLGSAYQWPWPDRPGRLGRSGQNAGLTPIA